MGMKVKFWGARGSIPSPGPGTVRIGGNTTCVEITANDNHRIIIDAGTGIRTLGRELISKGKKEPITLLLTHSHWDHLAGFIFFAPAFSKDFTIDVYGNLMAQEVLFSDIFQRSDNRYFPVNMDNFQANFTFHDKFPENFIIHDILIEKINLNHPGNGFGYKFTYEGKSVAFISDNEIGMECKSGNTSDQICAFCQDVNLLIHDAQFLPSEIENHRGWGHSTYEEVINLAEKTNVKEIILTHHSPERYDEECIAIRSQARSLIYKRGLKMKCNLAIEGDTSLI